MTIIHDPRPPEIPEILAELSRARVDFVIAGSVAALAHGVEVVPGDLDIVPATNPENLTALVAALESLEARPPGPFGEWTTLPTGERKWIARATTEEEVLAWRPEIDDVGTLDHLFRTKLGDLDVVPEIAGTYAALRERAVRLAVFGCRPWIAHLDDLLARLTVPRREKDAPRVARLREIQRLGLEASTEEPSN
jgi:hypothetical protein